MTACKIMDYFGVVIVLCVLYY